MRLVSILVFAALSLSACGDKAADQEGTNGAQDVSAETLGEGGDMTAIDAATAADANMAADVEYNLTDLNALNEADSSQANSAD
jgi:hypothetical protein